MSRPPGSWQPGANSQSALRAVGPRSGSKPARGKSGNTGNGSPQTLSVFLFFSEVSREPLWALPGSPSRPVACAGGQCRCCGGRASQDGGVAQREHSVTALAPTERRPVQQTLETPGRKGAAKRSEAAPRPGNEVFALLGGTGTGQCPVVGHRHHALIVLTGREGRRRPSWRTAWSVGSMQRSNASWRRASSVGADGKARRPAS